ncbi:MAG: hypothetical protein ACYCVL_12450 [Gemmatimonadaceae bacterium]
MTSAQAPTRNATPVVPYVVRNICPEEGCEFGEWTACTALVVRAAESMHAPALFTLARSSRFAAITGNVHVDRAGMVVFRDTVRIVDNEILAAPLVFTPADTLYPLFYGSKGTGTWYLHGKVSGGPWFFPDDKNGYARTSGVVLVRSPVVHWWVQIRNAVGRD